MSNYFGKQPSSRPIKNQALRRQRYLFPQHELHAADIADSGRVRSPGLAANWRRYVSCRYGGIVQLED